MYKYVLTDALCYTTFTRIRARAVDLADNKLRIRILQILKFPKIIVFYEMKKPTTLKIDR